MDKTDQGKVSEVSCERGEVSEEDEEEVGRCNLCRVRVRERERASACGDDMVLDLTGPGERVNDWAMTGCTGRAGRSKGSD